MGGRTLSQNRSRHLRVETGRQLHYPSFRHRDLLRVRAEHATVRHRITGPELADTILPHLRNKAGTILLANHGAVACGKDLMQAYWRLERLEMYCRILILSKQLGSVRPLPEAKVRQLLQYKKKRYGMDEDDPRMD